MLIDLIKQNRSYRSYDRTRQISREELLTMVEAARLCPYSVNLQLFSPTPARLFTDFVQRFQGGTGG